MRRFLLYFAIAFTSGTAPGAAADWASDRGTYFSVFASDDFIVASTDSRLIRTFLAAPPVLNNRYCKIDIIAPTAFAFFYGLDRVARPDGSFVADAQNIAKRAYDTSAAAGMVSVAETFWGIFVKEMEEIPPRLRASMPDVDDLLLGYFAGLNAAGKVELIYIAIRKRNLTLSREIHSAEKFGFIRLSRPPLYPRFATVNRIGLRLLTPRLVRSAKIIPKLSMRHYGP